MYLPGDKGFKLAEAVYLQVTSTLTFPFEVHGFILQDSYEVW